MECELDLVKPLGLILSLMSKFTDQILPLDNQSGYFDHGGTIAPVLYEALIEAPRPAPEVELGSFDWTPYFNDGWYHI